VTSLGFVVVTNDHGPDEFPDWDPSDPDVERVYYDLAEWSIDQQAAVSAAFADRGVPHSWEGFEVVVPQFAEEVADAVFEQLEARFGMSGDGDRVPGELGPDDPATEYDLSDWTPAQRATLVRAVSDAGIPLRLEDALLLVPVAAETVVDELLDAVESGDVMLLDDSDGEEPALNMTDLFTLADRLRREPKDQRGLQLLEVAQDLDPERPPYGVALVTWRQAVGACRRLHDALEGDEITVVEVAEELWALVRPFA
jgi:hypothetical protein